MLCKNQATAETFLRSPQISAGSYHDAELTIIFTEFGLDDHPRFRHCGAAQIAHESPHALVATREPVAVDQILPDTDRVPATLQLQRYQFTVRFAAARRSETRFPGQKAGDHLDGRF